MGWCACDITLIKLMWALSHLMGWYLCGHQTKLNDCVSTLSLECVCLCDTSIKLKWMLSHHIGWLA